MLFEKKKRAHFSVFKEKSLDILFLIITNKLSQKKNK